MRFRAFSRSSRRGRCKAHGGSSRKGSLLRPRFERLEERLALAATSAFFNMPTNLAGNQGTDVSVPVSISNLTDASGNAGLAGFDLTLTYDPTVFTVSDADVLMGSLLTNAPANGAWFITSNTSTPGEIDVDAVSNSSATDIKTTVGGVLLNIDFHIKGTAPTGNSSIHVVVPPATSPNGRNSDAVDHVHGAIYTLSAADQVDGVVNVQNFAPVTTLSIPTGQAGTPGQTITVPVNIGNPDPTGSAGMISADAALLYDPNVLTVASVGAVAAGSDVPGTGWSVSYAVDTSGNNLVDPTKAALGLHLSNTNSTPLTSTTSGSLWLVTFTINAAASGTTVINLVPSAHVGASTTTTNVTGSNKIYQLTPAPTNATNDTVDGSIVATPIVIAPTSLPQATAGAAYNQTVTVSGGTQPYTTFQVNSFNGGTTGLTSAAIATNPANGTVTISGTPSAAGSASFTVKVIDTAGGTLTQNYTLTVNAALLATPSSLPQGTAGAAYTQTITVSGGTQPYTTFQVSNFSAGNTGLTLASITPNSGLGTFSISGTPGAAGSVSFTVNVIDTAGATLTKNYTLTVNPVLQITPTTLPQATAGTAYSQTLTISGGTTTYSQLQVAINDAGTTGLQIANFGTNITANAGTVTINATPTVGTATFTVSAIDKAGATLTQQYTLTVNAALSVTPLSLPAGTAGAAYNQTITAGGGTQPYTSLQITNFNAGTTGLAPTAVTANATAGTFTISGTPTGAGSASFTLNVTDTAGALLSQNYTLAVNIGTTQGNILTVNGTAAKDAFSVLFSSATAFSVTLNGSSSSYTVGSSAGQIDQVIYHGIAGADTLVVQDTFNTRTANFTGGALTFSGTGFELDADGAPTINLYGKASDTATLNDTTAGDFAIATPSFTNLRGPAASPFVYQVAGFGTASVTVAAGSGAIGYLYSASGGVATANPTVAMLQASSTTETLTNFTGTYFQSSGDATEQALVYGTAGNDTFVGTPFYAYLAGTINGHAYSSEVINYRAINAFGQGGNDTANEYDSSGDDQYVSTPSFAYMIGGSGSTRFLNEVIGFATVIANSSQGGHDVAYLYDSAGNDTFTSGATLSSMNTGSTLSYASGFGLVIGESTAGGSDTATISDGTGSNNFFAHNQPHFVQMARITAANNTYAFGFAKVTAVQSAGTNDHKFADAVDYTLTFSGTWL